MSRRLRHYVTVRDDRHRVHLFGPSDDVPDWAVAAITLRSAWADDTDETPAEPPVETPVEPVEPTPPQDEPEPPAIDDGSGADDAETVEPVEPEAAPRKRGRPRKST